MTGLDIYGLSLGSSSRCKRMTKCKHGEQDPSALIRIAETFFPALIYACKMAFVLSQKELRSLQIQGQGNPRDGWTVPPSLRIWLVLIITVEDLNFHGYSSLS